MVHPAAVVVDNHEEAAGSAHTASSGRTRLPRRRRVRAPTAVAPGVGAARELPTGTRAAAARTRTARRRHLRGARSAADRRSALSRGSRRHCVASLATPEVRGLRSRGAELLGVALPVLGDLDVQVEVDPLAEQRLDRRRGRWCRPRAGADPPRPMTMAFCERPLDEHVDPHVEQRLALAAALARHASPRRRRPGECGSSSRTPSSAASRTSSAIMTSLGLVGEHAVGVERPGRRRQVLGEHRRDLVDLVAAGGRARARSRPSRPSWSMAMRCSASRCRSTRSVLVAMRDDRRALAPAAARRARAAMNSSPGPIRWSAGRQKPMTSTSSRVSRHQVVEPLPEQGARLVQPRGVDEDQLAARLGDDAADGVPGRLRLGRRDRDLLPDQRVGQRRLAGVGAPDEAGEPARHTGVTAPSPCSLGLLSPPCATGPRGRWSASGRRPARR